jgi:hypothetical protein
MTLELRRALEDRAERIGYRPPTKLDSEMFCTCHVASAVRNNSRYEVDYTHTRECFYVEYMVRAASRGGRTYARVETLNLVSEK